MYHYHARKQAETLQLRMAMRKEWNDQLQNGNFTVMYRSQVPEEVPEEACIFT
jgi:hypothetical protein